MAFADAGGYELEALAAEPAQTAARRYSAQVEDLYWAKNYWKQPYFHADYDYEDYAPAYCVGYSGCAQYGGSFEDAEKSLCANFIRIKGDSRLSWEEAIEPIRSAWARVEASAQQAPDAGLRSADVRVAQEPCTV
jgi:hypothetical protein